MARKKVVVVGGGYAGMACLSELRGHSDKIEAHLVDPHEEHLVVTYLHKTVQQSLKRFQVRFDRLAKTMNFEFHRGEVSYTSEQLAEIGSAGRLQVADKNLDFDYLVLATGSAALPLEKNSPAADNLYSENYLKHNQLAAILESLDAIKQPEVTLVGLGPTSIQFLFELYDYLKKKKRSFTLRALGMDDKILAGFKPAFHDYILSKCRKVGIEILLRNKFLQKENSQVQTEDLVNKQHRFFHSDLTLLFPGVRPVPEEVACNPHGQVKAAGADHIFACGDCAIFEGRGLNRQSGQAAVRKGKVVARNIVNHMMGKKLQTYDYNELGYFLSMGDFDGIGWVLWPGNVIKGPAAFVIKEAVEAQFALMLQGIDLY